MDSRCSTLRRKPSIARHRRTRPKRVSRPSPRAEVTRICGANRQMRAVLRLECLARTQRCVPVCERVTIEIGRRGAAAEADAGEEAAVGDAGRREEHVAGRHVLGAIDAPMVADADALRRAAASPRCRGSAGRASARRCSEAPPPRARLPARRRCRDRCRCRSCPGSVVWMMPATSPSPISRIEAPVERTASISTRVARAVEDAGGDVARLARPSPRPAA